MRFRASFLRLGRRLSVRLNTFVAVLFTLAVVLPWSIYVGVTFSARQERIDQVEQSLASLALIYGQDAIAHDKGSAVESAVSAVKTRLGQHVNLVVLRSHFSGLVSAKTDQPGTSTSENRDLILAQARFPAKGIAVQTSMRKSDALSQWRHTALVQGLSLLIRSLVVIGVGLFLGHQIGTHEATLRELSLARHQADAANRAKSEFLTNMSHELRTPLNAILGFSEMIKGAAVGPLNDPYREYAGYIFSSGTDLLNILNEVLDLSRLEAGRLALREDQVDMSETLEDSLRLVEAQAQKVKVALASAVEPVLPHLRADALRLKQALVNVLSNAIKFTPENGTVTLRAMQRDSGLLIEVTDTGIGIPGDQMEIALAPFGQIDGGASRKYGGAGLGLPIAKRLVELHGGTFTIQSAVGQGTKVAILLPEALILKARLQPSKSMTLA